MKAAFYTGTRSGWRALGSIVTRTRLAGWDAIHGRHAPLSQISHCELMIEPGDGADDLLPPDAAGRPPTAQPDHHGAHWLAGASASDAMPPWSPRRAGRTGGVRFKRIDVGSGHWWLIDLDWLTPAQKRAAVAWFAAHQGAPYDWQGIGRFALFLMPDKSGRWACHEALAAALGMALPHRMDPLALAIALQWASTWSTVALGHRQLL